MNDDNAKRSRVAVIAVHGVADQKPWETAGKAANMLARAAESAQELGENDRKVGEYRAFERRDLRIRVTRVPAGGQGEEERFAPKEKGLGAMLGDALTYRHQSQTVGRRLATKEKIPGDASHEYMAEQLSEYEVSEEDSIYETIRLESVRTGSKADVDVHEMYWADLSRFAGNWLRWIIEFYQLLFFLCLVGRKSLNFARAEYEPEAKRTKNGRWRAWPVFAWSQVIAEQTLTLFVPVLNLYLLGLALSVLPLLIPESSIPNAVVAFGALAAALGGGFLIYLGRTFVSPSGRRWPWWLLAPLAGVGAMLGLGLAKVVKTAPYAWLMGVWWLVPLAGILWAMAAFQKSERGALPTAIIVGAAVTGSYAREIFFSHDSAQVMNALLRTAEWTLLGVAASWVVLVTAAIVMTLSGAWAVQSVAVGKEREAARRAAWTANLTLVLPGLVVLILNLTLWQALISIAVPEDQPPQTASAAHAETPKSWLDGVKESSRWLWRAEHTPLYSAGPSITASAAVHGLIKRSQTPFYCVTWSLFVLAALLLVWTIMPAAVAELGLGKKKGMSRDEKQAASSWLGENLSAGFRAMRVSGEIVRWTFIALLPIGVLTSSIVAKWWPDLTAALDRFNAVSLFVGGWLVLALIASKGPFRVLALGLRSGLDVALDVINWLRLHPLDSNPRARICARFSSLLRHVDEWRASDDGEGYCAIVILAHSQGTVITADLLRYLKREGRSPRLPIYIFTMGCPLRQLYGLRFPHLYGWARHSDRTWAGTEPQPSEIGVELWVNAYRSGDYVGRYLWHPDDIEGPGNRVWSIDPPASENVPPTKREFCIGAGAHTHYWDETAPEIAIELDRLIGFAAH